MLCSRHRAWKLNWPQLQQHAMRSPSVQTRRSASAAVVMATLLSGIYTIRRLSGTCAAGLLFLGDVFCSCLEIETPKASSASRGRKRGEGCPLTIRLGVRWSVVSFPSVVRGGAPAENRFYAYFRSERSQLEHHFQYVWATAPPPNIAGPGKTSPPPSRRAWLYLSNGSIPWRSQTMSMTATAMKTWKTNANYTVKLI